MADSKEIMEALAKMFEKLNEPMKYPVFTEKPQLPELVYQKPDEKETLKYQIQQQTNQLLKSFQQQIDLLTEQNQHLTDNYNKLEALYKIKEKELNDATLEAQKARRYNFWMMLIAIIAVLVSIIIPIIQSCANY